MIVYPMFSHNWKKIQNNNYHISHQKNHVKTMTKLSTKAA